MAEVEDDALDLVEILRARLGAVERVVAARRDAGHVGPRVVGVEWLDPPFTVGHWVPEQIRRAGGWDLLGADGDKAVPTTWDAVRDVDPETLVLMPCGFHLPRDRQRVGADAATRLVRGALGGPPRPGVRGRRLGLFQPAGAAGHRRHRAARRDLRPGRVRRHRAARQLDAGGGLTERAVPRDVRLPVVRHAHTCRGADDIEGWAQLCPTCIGKAGDNGFLRFRLRDALDGARAATGRGVPDAGGAARRRRRPRRRRRRHRRRRATSRGRTGVPDYEARAPEYDDWYLRRGRYERGADPRHRLERRARRRRPLARRAADPRQIVELAAGTGWWSPLLAGKGELSIYDAAGAPLDRARDRLRRPRAPRPPPHPRRVGRAGSARSTPLFAGFWLSHVDRARLPAFLALARRWLRPGGTFAFIDSLPDPQSGAADHPTPADDRSIRRLDDGREFAIVKVYYAPDELDARSRRASPRRRSRRPAGSSCSDGAAA